ncbi:MAG: pyridoxamine 5'-phosphate oxidase family protein [Myxococcaceae bacterium]|nr:pyridoxamine 5'-phosphate oxidase family protein [Myxococcaceae bacterium]
MATRTNKKSGPEHVHDVLEDFETLMVGTYEKVGDVPRLRARPMRVAKLDDDNTLYFVTSIDTSKVDEALVPGRGTVVGQRRNRYLSALGRYEVLKDTAMLKDLWNPAFNVWFDGPEDPTCVLMVFHPEEVELWDSKGLKGVKYIFDAAKALITGAEPPRDDDDDQHEVVALQ